MMLSVTDNPSIACHPRPPVCQFVSEGKYSYHLVVGQDGLLRRLPAATLSTSYAQNASVLQFENLTCPSSYLVEPAVTS